MQKIQEKINISPMNSEEIRNAVNFTSLKGAKRIILGEIAVRATSWSSKTPDSRPLNRKVAQLSDYTAYSKRTVQDVCKFLRGEGYIDVQTISSFDPATQNYRNKENCYTLSPLVFYIAQQKKLSLEKLKLSADGLDTASIRKKIDSLKAAISKIKKEAKNKPQRAESIRGVYSSHKLPMIPVIGYR